MEPSLSFSLYQVKGHSQIHLALLLRHFPLGLHYQPSLVMKCHVKCGKGFPGAWYGHSAWVEGEFSSVINTKLARRVLLLLSFGEHI